MPCQTEHMYIIMDSLKPRKDIGWSSPHRKCLSRPTVVWARIWTALSSATEENNFHSMWSWRSCRAFQPLLLRSLWSRGSSTGSWASASLGGLPKLLEEENRGEYLMRARMNRLRWACQSLMIFSWFCWYLMKSQYLNHRTDFYVLLTIAVYPQGWSRPGARPCCRCWGGVGWRNILGDLSRSKVVGKPPRRWPALKFHYGGPQWGLVK